ncbi:hypothetical protein FJY70_00035 [candidate division WOR-3 bacterium]|nr:hypothetical protein [candidate division WOR-3 bacterium]
MSVQMNRTARAGCGRVLGGLAVLMALAATAGAQRVMATKTVGRGPTAVLYDSINHKVFVSNHGSGTVSVIDPNSNVVIATIRVGEKPNAMCWSPTSNKVFVACAPIECNGWVYVIDAAANRVVGSMMVGMNPAALAWCKSRNKVYCVNQWPGGPISVIGGADWDDAPPRLNLTPTASVGPSHADFSTDVPVIPIPGQTPNAIVYNPTSDRIYVSSAAQGPSAGTVWVINPLNDNIVGSVACGASSWELAVNPVGNRVYCSNRGSNTVSVINCANNQRLANLATPGEPHPVCWIPTNKLFVGEYWNRTVSFLHGESLRVRNRFPIPGCAGTMVYLPGTEKLFVANYLSGKVSACDARDGHEGVIVDLAVGSGPLGMAVNPDLKRVYVANSWDSTVTVISDEMAAPLPEPAANRSYRVSPRPNPGRVNSEVRFGFEGIEPSRLEVRDAAGRLVHVAFGEADLVWRPGRAGVYFCSLSDGNRVAVGRVTVR